MKAATTSFTLAVLITALGTGCSTSSTSPNTQKGAVGGAAAGALLGGIIGNNRGSGNAASGAAIGAVAGGLAGAAVGNATDRRNDTKAASADSQAGYVVVQPPPTPTSQPYETMTAQPSRDAIWIPGYYQYTGQGGQYQWMAGHWEVPPPGYRTWVQPSWQPSPDRQSYTYNRGHWQ